VSLVILQPLFLLLSLTAYIVSIVLSIVYLINTARSKTIWKYLCGTLLVYFIANLILFLIYLSVFVFNPEINWTLKNGGNESDPMILYAYVPPIFLLTAMGIWLISLSMAFLFLKIKDSRTNVQ
jgi:ABC-type dipeptide/oligopeptide/nickel transport system permease component